jgi:nucleoid-associated protein Lsr2
MARKVSVTIRDDLDGSEGASTVSFGLDGVSYEIDLAENNKAALRQVYAPFIEAARLAKRRAKRAERSAAPTVDRAAIRAWARSAGIEISERGRISTDVIRRYEDAH